MRDKGVLTHAGDSVWHHDVAVRTDTAEGAVLVDTRAFATQTGLLQTLVDICHTPMSIFTHHMQNTRSQSMESCATQNEQ